MALNVIQWNSQGIMSKKDELLQLVNDHQPMIIAIQETMLHQNNNFRLPNYSSVMKPGTFNRRSHGGVAIFVHESTPIYKIINLQTPLQAVAIQVSLKCKLTICSIYNSRSHSLTEHLLTQLVQQLPPPILLLGDLDAYHPLWGSPEADTRGCRVANFVQANSLNVLNDGSPTRIAGTSETVVDVSLASPALQTQVSWSVLPSPYDSDQYPIKICFNTIVRNTLTIKYCINKIKLGHFQ